jgi:hypothetical protein
VKEKAPAFGRLVCRLMVFLGLCRWPLFGVCFFLSFLGGFFPRLQDLLRDGTHRDSGSLQEILGIGFVFRDFEDASALDPYRSIGHKGR